MSATGDVNMEAPTTIPFPALAGEPATIPFPVLVPIEYDYSGGTHFYVRACYTEYYEYIFHEFAGRAIAAERGVRNIHGVNVTGTPGIGKAVFMAYAFQRFSREHPGATAIMASYTNQSKLKRLVIAQGGKEVKRVVNRSQSAMMDLMATYIETENDSTICLLDGPPSKPPEDVRRVAFCSPNERWLGQLQKNFTATSVFMPLWTPTELRDAAEELQREDLLRPVDVQQLVAYGVQTSMEGPSQYVPTVIEYRFAIFGGVARACLSDNPEYLKDKLFDSLRVQAGSLEANAIQAALQAKKVPTMSHSLLHYAPNIANGKTNVPDFHVQPVLTKSQFYADSTVSDITGIGPKTAAKLRAIRVDRVQDLYRMATGESEVPLTLEDRELVDRAVRLADEHVNGQHAAADGSDEARVVGEIPQYVWGV